MAVKLSRASHAAISFHVLPFGEVHISQHDSGATWMFMREIPLTRGKVALVDDRHFDWLNQYSWHAMRNAQRSGELWYARRRGSPQFVLMHREIAQRIGLVIPQGHELDHADGDGLHNVESNFRLATKGQNMQNRIKWEGCSSRFKGVSWNKNCHRWQSYINFHGVRHYLGLFNDEVLAALAYDLAARLNFGEFARCNFPQPAPN